MKYKWLILSTFVTLAGFLPQSKAALILGSAESFAVLGGATVTSTGGTVLNGDLGVAPGTSITGFAPGIVNGTTHDNDVVAAQAQADALIAYGILSGEAYNSNLSGLDLGARTLTPGVYFFSSSAQLTGLLTLDAQGVSDARFDFRIGSTLTTASDSSMILIHGAQANNVYWQVGSSATLGADTAFYGSILADQTITLGNGASMFGRALALNGAVNLDNNLITAENNVSTPEPGSFYLFAACASVFGVWPWLAARRRKFVRS